KEMLLERGNSVFDRAKAETPEEAQEIMRNALLSDVFLMSTNSMTEDGELFNIDGRGNRLAALIYGPKEVFIVLGTNKIVKNLDEAYKRVRHTVAPMNAKRLGSKTPCAVTGHCSECKGPNSICCHMLTTRNSFIPGRIKIFIINEELGF
ncbi:MAG: lactate utilization protein, partial [Clostridia bacterium]|nr:lactate utilization protein [Clostridia bacterium]